MHHTTLHVHVPFERIDEYIQFLRDNSFNLEIFFGTHLFDSLQDSDIRLLKENFDYGPELSFHAPFMDLSPGAVDPGIREVTMQRFSRMLDFAEILGPKVIVFHSGYERWKYAHNTDIWLEESLRTWRPLNERAARSGVKLAIENVFEDTPENLARLAGEMNSPNFGLCFDTGHFNLFARPSLDEWLAAVKPYIIAARIHDNNTERDEHIVPGEGSFDFRAFFTEMNGTDIVRTLEMHNIYDVVTAIERIENYMK